MTELGPTDSKVDSPIVVTGLCATTVLRGRQVCGRTGRQLVLLSFPGKILDVLVFT